MSFRPNINVWTLGKGARGAWKLQHATESIEEAGGLFERLASEGKQVALGELGSFLHNGLETTGQVTFWWTADLNEYMACEPQDRGVGWTDGFDTWVEYSVPDPQSDSVPGPWSGSLSSVPAIIPEPASQHRYVEKACERCGIILPLYQLSQYTREVLAGRSSGSSRSSRSTSSRSSSRSFSSGTTIGSSSSSGRSYYRTETMLLCAECLPKQRYDDRGVIRIIWDFLNKLSSR